MYGCAHVLIPMHTHLLRESRKDRFLVARSFQSLAAVTEPHQEGTLPGAVVSAGCRGVNTQRGPCPQCFHSALGGHVTRQADKQVNDIRVVCGERVTGDSGGSSSE